MPIFDSRATHKLSSLHFRCCYLISYPASSLAFCLDCLRPFRRGCTFALYLYLDFPRCQRFYLLVCGSCRFRLSVEVSLQGYRISLSELELHFSLLSADRLDAKHLLSSFISRSFLYLPSLLVWDSSLSAGSWPIWLFIYFERSAQASNILSLSVLVCLLSQAILHHWSHPWNQTLSCNLPKIRHHQVHGEPFRRSHHLPYLDLKVAMPLLNDSLETELRLFALALTDQARHQRLWSPLLLHLYILSILRIWLHSSAFELEIAIPHPA